MEQLRDNKEMDPELHIILNEWINAARALQHKRAEEVVCAKMGLNAADPNYESMLVALSLAVRELCLKTRAARSALWCSDVTLMYEGTPAANGLDAPCVPTVAPKRVRDSPQALAAKLIKLFDMGAEGAL